MTCTNGPNGDMFVNYMDYTDDACMAMFTEGQKSRVEATLNGIRAGLLTSGACTLSTGIEDPQINGDLALYPNPNNGTFTIQVANATFTNPNIVVFDRIGKNISNVQVIDVSSHAISLKLNHQPAGVYFVTIAEGDKRWNASFLVQ